MIGQNSSQKADIQQLIKIVDTWILKLKKQHDVSNAAELDQLPANYFSKVVDHQEFEMLLKLVTIIHEHEDVLFDCLHRKYLELSAVDRHSAIDAIYDAMRHADVSDANKHSWQELLAVLIPVRQRKAA
ncbi:MAG TPA: hypothetical protein VN457_01265 [Chlamydiales bacterium]|nr:hypothetical protein [Chlamydiales bacterium]